MSLLLEALKKAEQAKQGETTQQQGAGARMPTGEGLSLAPDETPAAGPGTSQPITRDRLPDITQNLEILSDDLASGIGAPPPRNAGPGGGRVAGAPRAPAGRAPESSAAAQDSDREAARQLFEAHTADYDPRRPFKLVLVGLAVAAIGIVVYFWWQTQPRSLTVAQSPRPRRPASRSRLPRLRRRRPCRSRPSHHRPHRSRSPRPRLPPRRPRPRRKRQCPLRRSPCRRSAPRRVRPHRARRRRPPRVRL